MKTILMKGACLAQRKETFACSSLGFQNEDVKHYQHIIYVLQQTERIMNEIDNL